MNILEVIKDCISNPCILKDYDIQELTVERQTHEDTLSIAKESIFSGKNTITAKNPQEINVGKAVTIDSKLQQLYMKIWAAFGKYILSETRKGNSVFSVYFGYFYPSQSDPDNKNANMPIKLCYSPNGEILDKAGLNLREDDCNILPSKRDVTNAIQ